MSDNVSLYSHFIFHFMQVYVLPLGVIG